MLAEIKTLSVQETTTPLIGREIYPVVDEIGPKQRMLLRRAYGWITNKETAGALESRMHNNSSAIAKDVFGDGRPASAYFTLLPDGTLVVEWGKINPNGEAKLHDFLNREIDFIDRRKNGAVIKSGHLATITVSGNRQVRVALLDYLFSRESIDRESPEYKIIATLLNYGIIPVTSDGYPVKVGVN